MTRPLLEVADIVRAQGDRFVNHKFRWIHWAHRKVLRAIARRTAALGGHRDKCPRCGKSGEPATPEQLESAQKNLCGGEDFFEAPSGDRVPFQLYFRYPKRSRHPPLYDYSGDQLATNVYARPR
jgi:hypothetical protein